MIKWIKGIKKSDRFFLCNVYLKLTGFNFQHGKYTEDSLTVNNYTVCSCKGQKYVKNATTIWFIFDDFSACRPDSMTFKARQTVCMTLYC